jgi:hypothetical protein
MRTMRYVRVVVLRVASALYTTHANASTIGYTTRGTFDTATVGLSGLNDLNFDSLAVAPLGAGPFQGVSFAFNTGTFVPKVINAFDTTSGTNSLGTTGDNTFVAGDSFTMDCMSSPARICSLVISPSQRILAASSQTQTRSR